MAGTITVAQAYKFGDVTQQGGSLAYVIQCTPDPSSGVYPNQLAVIGAVQAVVPSNTAMISTWGYILPLDDIKLEHITDALWMAEAVFKRPQTKDKLPEANGPVLDFDTSGGTQHITISNAATVYLASGVPTPPDAAKMVIGWDGGKKVKGLDIGYGVYRFSEEWQLPDTSPPGSPSGGIAATSCTPAYRAIIKGLTYQTNNAAFRGFAIGEVLFEGATGRRVKGGGFSVTYKFAVSPNATGLTVGTITSITKAGWQYLDVKMSDSSTAGGIYQVPAEVRVHSVYQSGDFSTLQIGTTAL